MKHTSRALRVAAFVTLSVIFTLAGCGKGDYPEMARVTGTVAYKGKPVPNIMVNFMPTEGRRPSWGKTDEEGRFEMVYDENVKGVEMGPNKVYFTPAAFTIDGGASKKSRKAIAEASGLTPEEMLAIRAKYGSEEVTKLVVDIKENPQVLDLKLE